MTQVNLNTLELNEFVGRQPLTHLTYEREFSDQSHFIREFRNFTGVAPKTFLKNREDFIVNLASTLSSEKL